MSWLLLSPLNLMPPASVAKAGTTAIKSNPTSAMSFMDPPKML
jgi:hypothetical protein